MDIRSLLASRTRWQPATETAATKANQGVADTNASTGTSSTSGVSGDSTKTQQKGGLTGTGGSTVGPLTALTMPSADSVAADKKQLGDELSMTLAIAGIKTSPPIEFSTDPSGNVTVSDSDPRAGDIRKALDNQPELKQRLNKLVSDAQLMEHGYAVQGWYKQVNAGTSGEQANKNLLAAAAKIDGAKGFTLGDEGLSLEVEGMGAKLMQADAAPPSDDEKMWRETLRLTNRKRDSGVTAAAKEENQTEQAEAKEQTRRKGKTLGKPDDEMRTQNKEEIQQAVDAVFRKTELGLAAIGPAKTSGAEAAALS